MPPVRPSAGTTRLGQGWVQHIGFIAVHALHLGLVAWLFRGLDWVYFLVFYVYLLVAGLLIARVRLYLQRSVALLLLVGALILNAYILTPTPCMEWFVPVFFLKLLVSHLVKEVPYPAEAR